MVLSLSPILQDQLALLLGAIAGATAAALIPYWNTIRQNEAQGLPPITFDKKFLGTMLIALAAGVVAGLYYFNVNSTTIDTAQTMVQIFATAAIASAVSNRALNSLLTVSATTTTVVQLKQQNAALQDEVNVLKLKVASVVVTNPVKKELAVTEERTTPIVSPIPTDNTTNNNDIPVKKELNTIAKVKGAPIVSSNPLSVCNNIPDDTLPL